MTKRRLPQNGKSDGARPTALTKEIMVDAGVMGAKVPSGSVPRARCLDTAKPGRFARVHCIPVGGWSEEAFDLLIVGGEGRQTGQAEEAETRRAGLEDWARQRFPMICGIEYGLSGRVMKSIFSVKNASVNRKQNQAGHSASERQRHDLPIYPTPHH